MVSPLLLRTINVKVYPEPKEIKVQMYAIGANKGLVDTESNYVKKK